MASSAFLKLPGENLIETLSGKGLLYRVSLICKASAVQINVNA